MSHMSTLAEYSHALGASVEEYEKYKGKKAPVGIITMQLL